MRQSRRLTVIVTLAFGAASLTVVTPPPAPVAATPGPAPSRTPDVDLVNVYGLQLQSMKDYRWADFSVGPPDYRLAHGRCGCLLSAWSTYFVFSAFGRSFPWFAHLQRSLTSATFEPKLSFSPEYIDEYLLGGKDPSDPWTFGRGYSTRVMGPGKCGTAIDYSALEGLAQPLYENGQPFTPTGFTWRTITTGGGLSAEAKAAVDAALNRGDPVVVRTVRRVPDGSGSTREVAHFVLLVGHDADIGEYLFLDTAWPSTRFFDTKSKPASQLWSGFSANAAMATITDVRIPTLHYGGASWWLDVADDPEPIELLLTAPDGRRTGYDPATGTYVYEHPDGSYEIGNGETDPLGEFPPIEDARRVNIHYPSDGVYGLEVVGTGDGPYVLHLTTTLNGEKSPEQDINATTTTGEVDRYEITVSGRTITKVTPVEAFGVRAEAGPDQYTLPGLDVTVDGHRSGSLGAPIASYAWDFGDGSSSTQRRATHAYAAAGTYTATLTVTDTGGATASDTLTVHVLAPPATGKTTTLVTRSLDQPDPPRILSAGSEIYPHSGVTMTPDGRHVAFAGGWVGLAPGDGEPFDKRQSSRDVFVQDLATGSTERLTDGTLTDVRVSDISDDGRLVLHRAYGIDWKLTDRGTDLASVADDTTVTVPGDFALPNRLSGNGQLLAYNTSQAVAPDDTNGTTDGYVLDRQTGASTRVTVAPGGTQSPSGGRVHAISTDGRFAAIAIGTSCHIRDLELGTTSASLDNRTSTDTITSNNGCTPLEISDDGTRVLFRSYSQAFFTQKEPDWRSVPEVFVRDTAASTTVHLGDPIDGVREVALPFPYADYVPPRNGSYGAAMSPDGRWVAFTHRSSKVVPGDTNATTDVFLYDMATKGVPERVSVRYDATQSIRFAEDLSSDPLVAVDGAGNVVFGWYLDPTLSQSVRDSDNLGLVEDGLLAASPSDLFRRGAASPGGAGSAPVGVLRGPYLGFAATTELPASVDLDATGSLDVDGDPLTAAIDPGDGSGPAPAPGLRLTHGYESSGRLIATVVASDATKASAPATTDVEILPSPGTDDVAVVPACASPGAAVTAIGVASSANADLLDGGWDLADGPVPLVDAELSLSWTGPTVAASVSLPGLTFSVPLTAPTQPGPHTVRLGVGGPEATLVVPCPPPPPLGPVAAAGGPYDAFVGEPVTLDGTGSTPAPPLVDALGGSRAALTQALELDYVWDLGDGSDATGSEPTHTYRAPGSYLVTLQVRQGELTSEIGGYAIGASALVTVRERLPSTTTTTTATATTTTTTSATTVVTGPSTTSPNTTMPAVGPVTTPRQLPATGSSAPWAAVAGLGLAMLGLALTGVPRRR